MTLPPAIRTASLLAAAGLALAACQSPRPAASIAGSGKSASLRVMEQVSTAAYRCWFSSKDPAFRPYRFANELNSFSGRPRFLLVPARDFGARPLLVVQAQGASSRVEVFGPLMDGPLASRISSDVERWRSGAGDCGAAA